MTKSNKIVTNFVDTIPADLTDGIIYISRKYKTATHLCACGCGNRVVTPLKPSGWVLKGSRKSVTLRPSIGNWNFPCRSHYLITDGSIDWARQWSQTEIEAGRQRDQRLLREHFDTEVEKRSFWHSVAAWFRNLFRGKGY